MVQNGAKLSDQRKGGAVVQGSAHRQRWVIADPPMYVLACHESSSTFPRSAGRSLTDVQWKQDLVAVINGIGRIEICLPLNRNFIAAGIFRAILVAKGQVSR